MNHDNIDASDLLDRWFNSNVWRTICDEAEQDDPDSLELMEQVNEQLQSLIFHINNKSGQPRIEYEISYFANLCEMFEVPIF